MLVYVQIFQHEIITIFIPISLKICFGSSHLDGSFEYPQHMFWLKTRKNHFQLHTLIWRHVIEIFLSHSKSGIFLTYEVRARGLLNLGEKHLDHQNWENLMQSKRTGCNFKWIKKHIITVNVLKLRTLKNNYFPRCS